MFTQIETIFTDDLLDTWNDVIDEGVMETLLKETIDLDKMSTTLQKTLVKNALGSNNFEKLKLEVSRSPLKNILGENLNLSNVFNTENFNLGQFKNIKEDFKRSVKNMAREFTETEMFKITENANLNETRVKEFIKNLKDELERLRSV
jgi:hypothetical protein